MGEAKQRRLRLEQLGLSEACRRADVARMVRSIDFVGDGGTCAMRAVTGQKALALLGVKSRLVFGAMLYRAGPDEIADTVAFCGPDNRAVRLDHKVLGHGCAWECVLLSNLVGCSTGRSEGLVPLRVRLWTRNAFEYEVLE